MTGRQSNISFIEERKDLHNDSDTSEEEINKLQQTVKKIGFKFKRESFLSMKVVVPTVIFELLYILILLTYFLTLDWLPRGMFIAFYSYEILCITFFIPSAIIVFIYFSSEDYYLILDMFVLGFIFIFDFVQIISLGIDGDMNGFEKAVFAIQRMFRVIVFYY